MMNATSAATTVVLSARERGLIADALIRKANDLATLPVEADLVPTRNARSQELRALAARVFNA
jgi:hypothetical protein